MKNNNNDKESHFYVSILRNNKAKGLSLLLIMHNANVINRWK